MWTMWHYVDVMTMLGTLLGIAESRTASPRSDLQEYSIVSQSVEPFGSWHRRQTHAAFWVRAGKNKVDECWQLQQ